MLSFTCVDNNLIVLRDNNPFLSFKHGQLCLYVGNGKASYNMSHGRFKFGEKISSKKPLYISSVNINDGVASVCLSDANGANCLTALFTANLNRMTISFKKHNEDYNRMWFRIPATKEETVYGAGEIFNTFNLRGNKLRIWVAEHCNPFLIAKRIALGKIKGEGFETKEKFDSYQTYYSQPTFISNRKYYMHSDTTCYCEFDFRNANYHEILIRDIAALHFGFEDSFEALANNLTNYLGRQPLLPDWVYDGAILGIQGGTEIVKEKLETVKKYDTKVAGVWCQDWEGRRITSFGKQLMWNWEWDQELYPGLDTEIWALKKQGVRFLGYINPFLAIEKPLYKYATEKGYCVKDKHGKDYLVKITTFPAAMVDLTNPDAYEWIKGIIKRNMIDFGLDGWMADFSEYLPTDCVLYSGEDAQKVHCAWSGIWAKVNREAIEESGKLGEIMFFLRAGSTATVKHATMMWTGDQHVDWSSDYGIGSVIPGTLSLAVCGMGLVHSDIGGYSTFKPMVRTPELFMRWAEMSAFSPVMRSHEGNQPDVNAQFDANEEVLTHHAKYSRIHAFLKPYIKTCVIQNNENGVAVMRPLFYYYDENRAYTEDKEYLLGRDILVAPVLKPGKECIEVYLPDDEWIHLWSGKNYNGGVHTIKAPLGEIPVFCRKESTYLADFLKLKEV